jgi:hypothetical protein
MRIDGVISTDLQHDCPQRHAQPIRISGAVNATTYLHILERDFIVRV